MLVPANDIDSSACYPDAHVMETDRHGFFAGPSVCGRIVFFDSWSDREIQRITETRLFEPAHDVDLVVRCTGGHLRPFRRRRCCRAPDASIRFGLCRLCGCRNDEVEANEARSQD